MRLGHPQIDSHTKSSLFQLQAIPVRSLCQLLLIIDERIHLIDPNQHRLYLTFILCQLNVFAYPRGSLPGKKLSLKGSGAVICYSRDNSHCLHYILPQKFSLIILCSSFQRIWAELSHSEVFSQEHFSTSNFTPVYLLF